jgi:hypothetical protein
MERSAHGGNGRGGRVIPGSVNISRRRRLVFGVFVIAASVTFGIYERNRLAAASARGMLQRLPAQSAIVLFLDFDTLRLGGILNVLSQNKIAEDPEYQTFVRATGFDYRRDLDRAAVSFGREEEFFVVKGKFDWKKLAAYAIAQGGACDHSLCRMPGSTPERRISFFPVQSNLMALAVGSDSFAATRLATLQSDAVEPLETPVDPVWLSIPADHLKRPDHLPAGTRMFATALASADKILLSLGPEGQQFEARLNVTCRTAEDAASLAGQLQQATSLLRSMIARENQKPNPKDLSGVLTAGAFSQAGRRVFGRWPLQPVFLESLTSGAL